MSMLPDDTKARKTDLQQKLQQTQVNDHFDKIKPEDKPQPYSDEAFKDATIQWLVETDQVCTTSMQLFFPSNIYMLSRFKLLNTPLSKK
jgi:hypothetical protein